MEKADIVREHALNILVKIFIEKSYSNIMIKNLGNRFSALDRAFISEIVYGTIKWKLRIDYIIDQFSNIKTGRISAPILNILRMGIYQLDFMSKVPQSAAVNESVKLAKKYGNPGAVRFVNGLLRNYIRNREHVVYPERCGGITRHLSVYYSYPEYLIERLIAEFGSEFTEEFLKTCNEVPPLTIRINKLKTNRHELSGKLQDTGIEVYDGKYNDEALILKNIPGIDNMEEYKSGFFTVQDESSMLASLILSPQSGEVIMDVCSAPGTKTTHIAEIMNNEGTIIAGDINSSKLKLVEQNAKRLGIDIISTVCMDASSTYAQYADKADRVLVDAPCSGLGILWKKPEIRWNRTLDDIGDIVKIQASILDASCKYVKPGGVMVYSTCTVLKDENSGMVSNFLERNRNFQLEDINTFLPDGIEGENCKNGCIEIYPNREGIDGFFIARMRRVE